MSGPVGGIGVFGGSFDPIHIGHLLVATETWHRLGLSRVLFVPTNRPPHKGGRALAPIEHRVSMVRLGIAGCPGLELGEMEAGGEVAYTVDTLRTVRRRCGPDVPLHLVIGSDSLLELDSWRDPDEIVRLARLAVYERPGSPIAATRFAHIVIDGPPVWISSSAVRERVRDGAPITWWVPPAVAAYVERRGLYAKPEAS